MKGMEAIAAMLKAHYEKIVAFSVLLVLLLSLLYLVIEISSLQQMQKDFDREIDLKPAHPHAELIDPASFDAAIQKFDQPTQLALDKWSGPRLFLAENRMWCLGCRRPIELNLELERVTCPFCGAVDVQPTVILDSDRDGIPDEWEKKWGLNPMDAADADGDIDGDGWTNLEEFGPDPKAETPLSDATVAASTPGDQIFKVSVEKIDAIPLNLRFEGVTILPGNKRKFQLNIVRAGSAPLTAWYKLEDTVEAWKIDKFEEKFEMRKVPGIGQPVKVDVSELTISRDGKSIVLVKGQVIGYEDLTAHLYFSVDKSRFKVAVKDVFALKDKKYRVARINKALESVEVQGTEDNKMFTVKRKTARD